MINKFGYDIFNNITLYLNDYKDILSLRLVNRDTYFHEYENKEIELYFNSIIDLQKVEKIITKNIVMTRLPPFVKICIFLDCFLYNSINIDTIRALHIKDCSMYSFPLIHINYESLVALYLYNFIVDPDDLILPNLEYLCIYDSDYDDTFIYMFDVKRFPKLVYLDIYKIYIDDESAEIPFLEYYNGQFQHYNMPNLKYLEWNNTLFPESFYLYHFPKLIAIITYSKPNIPFNSIKLINPTVSKIAREYYNRYFLLK